MPEIATKDIFEEEYDALPENIRAVLSAPETVEALEGMGKKFGIHLDQLDELFEEVGLVLLGISRPSMFTSNLQKKLGLPRDQINAITKEVNEKIFQPIRDSLKKVHGENEDLPKELENDTVEQIIPLSMATTPRSVSEPTTVHVEIPDIRVPSYIPNTTEAPVPEPAATASTPIIAPEPTKIVAPEPVIVPEPVAAPLPPTPIIPEPMVVSAPIITPVVESPAPIPVITTPSKRVPLPEPTPTPVATPTLDVDLVLDTPTPTEPTLAQTRETLKSFGIEHIESQAENGEPLRAPKAVVPENLPIDRGATIVFEENLRPNPTPTPKIDASSTEASIEAALKTIKETSPEPTNQPSTPPTEAPQPTPTANPEPVTATTAARPDTKRGLPDDIFASKLTGTISMPDEKIDMSKGAVNKPQTSGYKVDPYREPIN